MPTQRWERMGFDELMIALRVTEDGQLQVRLDQSPVGVDPEFEPLRLKLSMSQVHKALDSVSQMTQPRVVRSGGDSRYDPIAEVGRELYAALFRGQRRYAFERSRDMAVKRQRGLRLRLILEDEEPAALPWEFMHDGYDFIGLSSQAAVVRTMGRRRGAADAITHRPQRMLVLDCRPGSGFERSAVQLEKILADSALELVVRDGLSFQQMVDELSAGQFTMLYLAGLELARGPAVKSSMRMYGREWDDGRFDESQSLVFFDHEGKPEFVPVKWLGEVLESQLDLRLVFLGMPNSHQLAGYLAPRLPVVIGIQGEMSPEARDTFTLGFYRAVVGGLSIEGAVTHGRQEIDLRSPGSREWGLPILYRRTGEGDILAPTATEEAAEALATGVPAEEATSGVTPPADPDRRRQWDRLQLELQLKEQNLQSLENQMDMYVGDKVRQLLQAEIDELKGQIADLTARMESLATES